MIVDDDPSVLRLLKTILERGGYVPNEARDGREAMNVVAAGMVDVIVSDMNMPGYGGMEFLRGVNERNPDIPFILLTGKPTLDSSNRAMGYRAFRYLLKPVAPKTLTEAVDSAVQVYKAERLKRAALELQGEKAMRLGDRASCETHFDSALSKLWMAFQPIVSWRSRSAFGYEALLRSDEPALGNAGVILDAAERLGRLRELGRSIRTRLANLQLPAESLLFVNLHANDLLDDELYLPQNPLYAMAQRVVLEITERACFDSIKDLHQRIARLRSFGFKFAIDDIGTGYAGLTSFTRLEPEFAKVDLELVRNIHLDNRKQSIVRALSTLCNELNIHLIAEGIETPEERDTLVDIGCDHLQGFLFGRPVWQAAPPQF